jgi:hypothetical protein
MPETTLQRSPRSRIIEPELIIPTVRWDAFKREFKWEQGEHATLIGPTGVGKTTLAAELLEQRKWVVAFLTKSRDETYKLFRKRGFQAIKTWPPPPDMRKVMLWPVQRASNLLGDNAIKRREFAKALEHVNRSGSWTLYFDEVRFLTRMLQLAKQIENVWMQGRSADITVVASTQRSAWIPLEAYSETKHLIVWDNPDEHNTRRLKEISGVQDLQQVARQLRYHQFIYSNNVTRKKLISELEMR